MSGVNTTTWYGMNWIRQERRDALHERDGWACVYCGRSRAEDPRLVLTLDHVSPRSNGEYNASRNLVTACLACNSAKRDHSLRRFVVRFAAERGLDPDAIRRRVRNAQRRKVPGGLDGRRCARATSGEGTKP